MEEDEGAAGDAERRGSDSGITALLTKTKEFFQTCDVEGKGFLTRSDMRVRNDRRMWSNLDTIVKIYHFTFFLL